MANFDITHLLAQVVIAVICAGLGNLLIPRKIPGRFFGLVFTGLIGVWVGEWGYFLLRRQYKIAHPILEWAIQGVPIVPAVVGSAIVIYLLTAFLKWGRYN